MTRGKTSEPSAPDEAYEIAEGTLAFYSDAMHVQTSLYSAELYFGDLRGPNQKPLLRAKIKVSPQMLKAISLLTQKHVKDYEGAIGPIVLPKDLLHSWGLEDLV